jgi:hypothetical protein
VPFAVRPLRGTPSSIVAVLAVLVLSACDNDARDSHCEPEGGDDRCISSPEGNGPFVSEPACAAPTAADPVPGSCPEFGAVVEFMRDPARGNCYASGCHGSLGTAAIGIHFPSPDEQGGLCAIYTALFAQRGSVGRSYLTPDDPETPDNEALGSWMYCNVLGLPGGGFPMPKPGGVHDPADADVVRDFILCGAPSPCEEGEGP